MNEETIRRINQLSQISKMRELTIDEKEEREKLRKEYIEAYKKNYKNQMQNVYVKEKNGEIKKITDK